MWSKQFKKDNQEGKRKRGVDAWPADRPDYFKFVMYKENMDTNAAVQDMSKYSKVQQKLRINVTSIKDKRGIACQFCTLYRHKPIDLICLNRSRPFNSFLRVGNISYANKQPRLGKLNGNRFNIALRNIVIEAGKDDLSCDTNLEKRLVIAMSKLE